MIGVVYKFQPYNKLNGSLFYCFEYATFLRANLYLVDINEKDLALVKDILLSKYSAPVENIVSVSSTQLYFLKLDATLILDVKTFYRCKEFLTGDIHVFSNEPHDMFRYKNGRNVTYYGSYDYQNYDVFNYLKLNFNIFDTLKKQGNGVFISGAHIPDGYQYPDPNRRVIVKKHDQGFGNLFEMVDTVHYIHSGMDTNNRIIPEAFYYNKTVTIEDNAPHVIDSATLRYNDIIKNGLGNYTLTNEDEMVKACLKYNS